MILTPPFVTLIYDGLHIADIRIMNVMHGRTRNITAWRSEVTADERSGDTAALAYYNPYAIGTIVT